MDILERIVAKTRKTVAQRANIKSLEQIKTEAENYVYQPISLRARLVEQRPQVIAEFKRKSPSKSSINPEAEPVWVAEQYESGGASAMSILTETDFFAGSIEDLKAVRQAVKMPLLRKDFLVEPYQFFEARAMGADLVLLIARCLSREQLASYTLLSHALGMEVLCEIHDLQELEIVDDAPIDFLGVNCRDLQKFDTNIGRLADLAADLPQGIPLVAESGIHTRDDLWRLYDHGYQLFLIGEYLMRSTHPQMALHELLSP